MTFSYSTNTIAAWLTYWKEPSPSSAFLTDLWTRENALYDPNAFPDLAAVQLKGSQERTSRVCESGNKRILAKDASCSRNTNQSGAPHATFGEPFHVPSGSSRANDAAALPLSRSPR